MLVAIRTGLRISELLGLDVDDITFLHLTEAVPPMAGVYAVRRGHRGVFVVPHKHRMIARWQP